ncbi:AraC family transcriptional regulator [Pontiella agarivorans]|uniref:DNA-binding transcriptional regulator n=1 Tax=Pontiella agarivorans TaxID=3038953 RepID=A0ABU5MU43_9BACT|nr:DNA-binding transcriptional regulator [Pontiella agarivorans]MDZ8117616.1 DNA-binding transcriptional regulator [Pontiella agarivorans]
MPKRNEILQVAIMVSTSSAWGRRIVKGILTYANEVGPWHIWVSSSTESNLRELPKGWRGDGIIGRVVSNDLAEELEELNLPIVNVGDVPLNGYAFPCVRTDDAAATKMAADHLVNRGFKSIAYVGSSHNPNPLWYGKAFKRALEKYDLDSQDFYLEGPFEEEYERLSAWLKELPKPTGLLVWGHGNGRFVVDLCMSVGIAVPHDIAILCGSYDELLSHACFPALSGINSPTEQIGYKAAELMHRMLQGKKVPAETIYLPPLGVVDRLSTDTLAVDDPKLVKVVNFIKDHAFESITMADILKEVPMARRSLERRFMQMFGRSPIDEIRRLRINKARQLLAETDLPMQDIAEACGFATYNYLTHVFKQVTGSTPRDYRKKMRVF